MSGGLGEEYKKESENGKKERRARKKVHDIIFCVFSVFFIKKKKVFDTK